MDTPVDPEAAMRREFLKKVGRLGVAVPATTTLLLAASVTPASAQGPGYGGGCQQGSGASGSS